MSANAFASRPRPYRPGINTGIHLIAVLITLLFRAELFGPFPGSILLAKKDRRIQRGISGQEMMLPAGTGSQHNSQSEALVRTFIP